jgi:hypothetical protein
LGVEVNKCLPSLTLKIFYIMSLIKNKVIPTFCLESERVLDSQLVGSHYDMMPVRLISDGHEKSTTNDMSGKTQKKMYDSERALTHSRPSFS